MKVNSKPIVLRLTDRELYNHPFIFMSDVGWMKLSETEKKALKLYLQTGGFLWIDDFWGDAEWNNMVANTGNLDPNWKWRPIADDHPILRIVYRLKGCPQVPARLFFDTTGLDHDPPHVPPLSGRRR